MKNPLQSNGKNSKPLPQRNDGSRGKSPHRPQSSLNRLGETFLQSGKHLIREGDSAIINTSNHILSEKPHISNYLSLLEQVNQRPDLSVKEVPFEVGLKQGTLKESSYRKFKEKLEEFIQRTDLKRKDWDSEETEDGVSIWTMDDDETVEYRSEVLVDVPLNKCVKYGVCNKYRMKIDRLLDRIETVEKVSPQINTLHMHVKMPWPFENRELFVYRFSFYLDKDTFVVVAYDADDVEYIPFEGCIRIRCELAGSIFKRVGQNQTKVTTFSSSNPHLKRVPLWMMKSKTKDMALFSRVFKLSVERDEATQLSTQKSS